MRTLARQLICLLACLVLLVGCGGGDGDETAPTATPTAETPMAMGKVQWASDIDDTTGEPTDAVETFGPQADRIVAVIEVENVSAGTTFTATWTIDGLEVPEADTEVAVEEDLAVAWVSFRFDRIEGKYFPLGELQVTITSSTGETVDGTVEITLDD